MKELSWDEYLMGAAHHAALKSKDSTKVGAALIAPNERSVLLTGYNGPPAGVDDAPERRERPTKYLYAVHAEAAIIATAARHGVRTEGCSLYVTHEPCAACARTLIGAGIRKIVYDIGSTSMPAEEFEAAREMASEAGVLMSEVKGG